jgi:hypothetical protein
MEEVEKEDLRSKAYQLSEILVNDPGEPENWDTAGSIKRIGLNDETYNKNNLISLGKVTALESRCGNYDEVKNLLGLDKSFSIIVFNISQSTGDRLTPPLCSCVSPDLIKTSINTTVRRITALYNDNNGGIELAEIIVQM